MIVGPNSNDRLMMSAPWSAAYRMPLAIAAVLPSPAASSTRTGMMLAA